MNINNPVNKILRIERNMTQKDLAEKIHVSPIYLNQVINGWVKSEIVKLKVSKALRRPVEELWPSG